MKPQRSNAFTMIEMLTVVVIIGILISLLFPVIKGAIQKAENSQARQDIKAIAHAYQTYYNEYGYLPSTSCNPVNAMTNVICGYDKTYNTRGVAFLNIPTRKGAIDSSGDIVDPWASPYQVMFDCGYTNTIYVGPNSTTVHALVVVFSYGRYGNTGSVPDPTITTNGAIFSFQ